MTSKSKTPKEGKSKDFTPFTISYTCNTIQEARLLYHVFNTANLLENLQAFAREYHLSNYSHDIAKEFEGRIEHDIAVKITEQGFEI